MLLSVEQNISSFDLANKTILSVALLMYPSLALSQTFPCQKSPTYHRIQDKAHLKDGQSLLGRSQNDRKESLNQLSRLVTRFASRDRNLFRVWWPYKQKKSKGRGLSFAIVTSFERGGILYLTKLFSLSKNNVHRRWCRVLSKQRLQPPPSPPV